MRVVAMSAGEFSVYQFFPDESYERVREFVSAEEAVLAAKHFTSSVGAKIGTILRRGVWPGQGGQDSGARNEEGLHARRPAPVRQHDRHHGCG